MARYFIAGIALILGGWFTFEGVRACLTGEYTTAKSGPHAGQLGPWTRIVSSVGLEPKSGIIKGLHLTLGICWLLGIIAFFVSPALGWWTLLLSAVFSLWYLPIGTVLSLVELGLLLLPRIRNLH